MKENEIEGKIVDRLSLTDDAFAKLSREILEQGDSIRFKAHGSSMLPLIHDGDLLTIQSINLDSIKNGSVIFYQAIGGKCIAHRVVKIEPRDHKQIILTRGDASPKSEERIQPHQILGHVVGIQRGKNQINPNRNVWWLLSRVLPGSLLVIKIMMQGYRKFFGHRRIPKENSRSS